MGSDSPGSDAMLSSNGQRTWRACARLCAPPAGGLSVCHAVSHAPWASAPASRGCKLGGDTAGHGQPSSLTSGSSVLSTEPDPGMASSEIDIAVIAGTPSGGPSNSQEGQRKHSGEDLPWPCFPSLKGLKVDGGLWLCKKMSNTASWWVRCQGTYIRACQDPRSTGKGGLEGEPLW